MKIIFDDLTVDQAWDIMNAVVGKSIVSIEGPGVKAAMERALLKEDDEKPRRRRRTKVEMEEAREEKAIEATIAAAGKTETHTEEQHEELAKRGRRRRRPATEESTTEEEPRRRRRRSAPEDSPSTALPAGRRRRGRSTSDTAPTVDAGSPSGGKDEITDRDVSKAASEGAAELTPAAVRGILDQFAVANVGELDQEQRREFIDMVEDAIADADLDGED